MENAVDQTIAGLRSVLSAQNNAELARKPGLDQCTISSWRARGRVPNRFVEILKAPTKLGVQDQIQVWPELQERGTSIALIRFTLLRQELAQSKEVDRALPVFLDMKPFWLILHRTIHELRLRMENLGVDLKTAQALVMQDDLRDPKGTAQRVADQMQEDLVDSPELGNWK